MPAPAVVQQVSEGTAHTGQQAIQQGRSNDPDPLQVASPKRLQRPAHMGCRASQERALNFGFPTRTSCTTGHVRACATDRSNVSPADFHLATSSGASLSKSTHLSRERSQAASNLRCWPRGSPPSVYGIVIQAIVAKRAANVVNADVGDHDVLDI